MGSLWAHRYLFLDRHIIFLWLKTRTLQNNEPYQIDVVRIWLFWIPIVERPRKSKIMRFSKKQNKAQAFVVLHFRPMMLFWATIVSRILCSILLS